jgi:hypothetical protein
MQPSVSRAVSTEGAAGSSPSTVHTSDLTVMDALAGGTTEPVARFAYDVVRDAWWWSPELYALHGLSSELPPSTDLLLSHKHVEDRPATENTLRSVLATGEPFCCRHRIIDAQGKVHTVLSLGEGICDESGYVVAVRGYFIDLTESLRRQIADATADAVTRSAATRAVIEQAKGVLVAAFAIHPDTAFDLLTWYSQHTNTKVRVLAQDLVDHFVDAPAGSLSPARRVRGFLNAAHPDLRLPHPAVLGSTRSRTL